MLIHGNKDLKGGNIQLNAGISSQFISSLMMIGPCLKGGLSIELQGDIISGPYIEMTKALIGKCGATVLYQENELKIPEKDYGSIDFRTLTEPDWSAAAFWFEIVALSAGAKVLLVGLKEHSAQGDAVLPEIYKHLGVKSVFTDEGLMISNPGFPKVKLFDFDFSNCPDLAQAVIVTCAALGIKGRFTGLKTLRIKETDRIAALQVELTALGFTVEVIDDCISLDGSAPTNIGKQGFPVVKCYDDHRMAMSFAPLALIFDKIGFDEPEVVKKSYPGFWIDLLKVGFLFG
jgi:3-phosphoshikimate 1-carboxyvinyltransferase